MAEQLGRRHRTVRHWVQAYRHEQLRALPSGRTAQFEPRCWQELLDWLEEVGPGVGLATLHREFAALPRGSQELLRRYRWVWQKRHQREVQVLHWPRPGSVWAIDRTRTARTGGRALAVGAGGA